MTPELVSTQCDICNRIISRFDLPDVLSTIVKTATECLNAKASSIRLLDEKGYVLNMAAAYGLSKAYLEKGPVEINASPIDQEALVGQVAIVWDAAKDARFQYPDEARREGIASVLCVPLRAGIKTIGVLRVYTAEPREFAEEEVNLLYTLACHGAVAIENARMRHVLKRQYDELMRDIWHWYDEMRETHA